jgi:TonB family protein
MGLKIIRHTNRPASPLSLRGGAMKTSVIISVLFHLCLLLIIQRAFPMNWDKRPLRTYSVELMRPPLDTLKDASNPGDADLSKLKPRMKTRLEATEDTISLDTKDKRYSSYANIIKKELMRNWDYPEAALRNLIEGDVLVLFALNRQGHLNDIEILRASADKTLDQEVVRAIRTAAPFPPFPDSVAVATLKIKANFAYRLTARR